MISTAHRIQPNYWEQALQPNEVVVRLGRFNFLKKRKTEITLLNVDEITLNPDLEPETKNLVLSSSFNIRIAQRRSHNCCKTKQVRSPPLLILKRRLNL